MMRPACENPQGLHWGGQVCRLKRPGNGQTGGTVVGRHRSSRRWGDESSRDDLPQSELSHRCKRKLLETRALLLGARTILGAPGIATRNNKLLVTRALLL